jgi:hypothetical protein
LSYTYVDLSDVYVNMSDNHVDLSDSDVDLSDIMSTCQKNMLSTGWHKMGVGTFSWWIFEQVTRQQIELTSQQKDLRSRYDYLTNGRQKYANIDINFIQRINYSIHSWKCDNYFYHIFSFISMWYHSCDNFLISHSVFQRHIVQRIKYTK